MTHSRPHTFDESMISGYLDGTLTQRDTQRARLHLEDCETCRALHRELLAMREAALSTPFQVPADDDWPELPKTPASRLSRYLGWGILGIWLLVVSAFALWRFLSQTGDPLEVFLVLGLPGAFLLLFASVVIDRLQDMKTDRYRGVQR